MTSAAPALLRSYIEFSKRVYLDRLTVDGQPLLQPDTGDIDEGPGDAYDYAAFYDAFDFGIGADCSGGNGIVIGAAIFGAAGMSWARLFSTETFGAWGAPLGFRQTTAQDLLNNYYPIKVWIYHGGGGPNSHMMCMIDGWQMESNGTYGTCSAGHGATSLTDPMWNDWWVYDGPITEDTDYRTPTQYPRGLDYAGGSIPGSALVASGIQFVMRYLNDGGVSLPGKQLQPAEFQDCMNNGLLIGFNMETDATFMIEDNGTSDALQSLNFIKSLPGIPGNAQPTVFFSADFDEAQTQDATLIAYLQAAAGVLGLAQTWLYGDYYVCKRMMDAGVIGGFWQTEAWSSSQDGFHIDSRVAIVQRNNAGFQTVNGIQCDINEAHLPLNQCGLWGTSVPSPAPAPPPPSPLLVNPYLSATAPDGGQYAALAYSQLAGALDPTTGYGSGWPQLGDGPASPVAQRSLVDYMAKYKPLWDAQLANAGKPLLQVPVPKGQRK